ncbi:hypothetical protein HY570_00095 [Candidatus Micrarchaeota archaeon]|nr:hypothetical protein [Candidatus Micrarchaeota archaeon]
MANATYAGRPNANLPSSRKGFGGSNRLLPSGRSEGDMVKVVTQETRVLRKRSRKAGELHETFTEKILVPLDEAVTTLRTRMDGIKTRIRNGELSLSSSQIQAIEHRMRDDYKLAVLNEIVDELTQEGARLEALSRTAQKEDLQTSRGIQLSSFSNALRGEIGDLNQGITTARRRLDKRTGDFHSLRIEAVGLSKQIGDEIESMVLQQVARNENRFDRVFGRNIASFGKMFAYGLNSLTHQTRAAFTTLLVTLGMLGLIQQGASERQIAYAAPPTPTPAAMEEGAKPTLTMEDEQRIFAYFNRLYDGRLPETEFEAIKDLLLHMKTKDKTLTLNQFIALYNFHRANSYDAISNLWKNKSEKKKIMALLDAHIQTKREIMRMIAAQKTAIPADKLSQVEQRMMWFLGDGMFQKAKERTAQGKEGLAVYRVYGSTIESMCVQALKDARQEAAAADMSAR